MDETSQFNMEPHEFPYGHSKHLAEQVMAEYVEQGLDAVSVLPSGVFGPRDLKFISGELIIQALKGIPALPKGGLNYIDVRDCVVGQIAAAEKGRSGERYILAGTNMKHREAMQVVSSVLSTSLPLVDIPSWLLPIAGVGVEVLHKLGVKLPINREALLMGGRYLYYDNAKAVKELGLQVRPFAESIRDAYLWYLENGYLEKRGVKPSPLPVSSM
jgi:dihydroflavonol-4-reductase